MKSWALVVVLGWVIKKKVSWRKSHLKWKLIEEKELSVGGTLGGRESQTEEEASAQVWK